MDVIFKFLLGKASGESQIEDYLRDIDAVIQRKDDYIRLKKRFKECNYDERMTALHRYEVRRENAIQIFEIAGILLAIMVIPAIDILSKLIYAVTGEGSIVSFIVLVFEIFVFGIVTMRGIFHATRDAMDCGLMIQIIKEVNNEENTNNKE